MCCLFWPGTVLSFMLCCEFKAEKGEGAKEKYFNKVDSDGNGFVEPHELDQ